jgi:pilus assembly protein Flp/PilA
MTHVGQRSLTVWSDIMSNFYAAFMEPVMRSIIVFVKDERAATAIEYGLIAAGIAVIIIPVLTGMGSKLKTTFTTVQAALK